MKISAIAAKLQAAGLLATDAKPEAVTAALNTLLAADKKAKDEEKEKLDKEAADKAAADKKAKDESDDPEETNDEDLEGEADDEFPEAPEGGAPKPGGKDKRGKDKAMDSKSVAVLIAANDAKHAAAREVESILGVVAFDSAGKYYKAALDKLGVDTAGVHESALPALLKLAKDKSAAGAPVIGDSAASAEMVKAIPGLSRLRK